MELHEEAVSSHVPDVVMASAWAEEETFACSVCLETLKDPATLPCGHSYCLACIQNHWDRAQPRGQYSCPQCRQVFNPRPSLSRSTVLMEAMEKLRTNSFRGNSISSAPPEAALYLELIPGTDSDGGGGVVTGGPSGEVGGPRRQGSIYPTLPSVAPRSCPLHQHPLELYCHDCQECVCTACRDDPAHQEHHVPRPEDERRERQKELVQMQVDIQKRIQDTEKHLRELPHLARQHKASIQAVQTESSAVFSELVGSVEAMAAQVSQLLCAHEASLPSRTEVHIQGLEQEVAMLRWRRRNCEEVARLAEMEDPVCFLKNFLTLEPLPVQTDGQEGPAQEQKVVTEVRSAVTQFRDQLQDLCKTSMAQIVSIVNDSSMTPLASDVAEDGIAVEDCQPTTTNTGVTNPRQDTVYDMVINPPPRPPLRPQASCPLPSRGGATSSSTQSAAITRPKGGAMSCAFPHSHPRVRASATPPPLPPPRVEAPPVTTVQTTAVNPEPQTREDMLKYHFEPTMDPNTAYRNVQVSDGGRKATLKAENQNPADHPDRFTYWRQILCSQGMAGSPYYWEVDWTGQKITIGVAYKDLDRKGSDDQSRLGHNAASWTLYWSGTGFSFWHQGQETLLGSPKARRVGVYLDQHSGVLSFYRIHNDQALLIHRHQTQFNGPLYPGFRFWAGVGSTVTICKLD